MVGYLSFLKVGPQLLRFIPGKKAQDLRSWLTIYGYWNQVGGAALGLHLSSSWVLVPPLVFGVCAANIQAPAGFSSAPHLTHLPTLDCASTALPTTRG